MNSNQEKWIPLWQVEPEKDAYRLPDGKVITMKEFEKLESLMPLSHWIIVKWGKLPKETN